MISRLPRPLVGLVPCAFVACVAGGPAPPQAPSGASADGWLHTKGNRIVTSDGRPWMGRGVNVDDVFFCGYNRRLTMKDPDRALTALIDEVLATWKPNFLRLSLSMNSLDRKVGWLTDTASYAVPMTSVIKAIGRHPGVYVLVTVRSDLSMIGHDLNDGDPEATGIPSDAKTTPDAARFPRGTDPVYEALVDAFARDPFVLFGVTNEPGGNERSDAQIAAAMSHAVGIIRAEEDRLGAPHHLVAVQGNGWTSDIGGYAKAPLPYDDVVYEVHAYPPKASSYTYANLPVILGEYGKLTDSDALFADLEAKQIPSLAWDLDPFSDCAPDLVEVNERATDLRPTAWGRAVKAYLLAHAPP